MNDMQSDEIDVLATALGAMQSEVLTAKKDTTNPFFKSKYADLESCWDAIREALGGNGLSITQTMGYVVCGEQLITTLKTTLMHSSGQWIQGEMPLFLPKMDAQAQGSAITYARRYGLAAITGLVQVDDDANTATHGGSQQQQGKQQPPANSAWPIKAEQAAKEPPPPKPAEKQPPVTAPEWESMTRVATANDWADGYVNQFIKDRRNKGMSDWDIYQAGLEKFSVKNPNVRSEATA
jgi:hypothetical protein